jgi:predicted glycosyl hydrolase (DUF1957 family)
MPRDQPLTFGDVRLPERFWQKVITEPNSGCWIWLAGTDKKGYGFFWYKGKKRWAHRLVKRFRRTAHHTCFNTSCVNPDHLKDVARSVNSSYGHSPYTTWQEHKSTYPESVNPADVPF